MSTYQRESIEITVYGTGPKVIQLLPFYQGYKLIIDSFVIVTVRREHMRIRSWDVMDHDKVFSNESSVQHLLFTMFTDFQADNQKTQRHQEPHDVLRKE